MESKKSFYEASEKDIEALGFEKRYLLSQVKDWVYNKHILSFDEMTNVGKEDREKLNRALSLSCLEAANVVQSKKDATEKILFKTAEGYAVESVLIPDKYDKSLTLCVSSQVGCVFDCTFCATGKLPFKRSLRAPEIINQYVFSQRRSKGKVKNIVFMGMGEPFALHDELWKTLDIFCDKERFAIGERRLSVSTIGLVDKIKEFALFPRKHHLLVSLHSAIQEKRDLLMPNMKTKPLTQLKEAILFYNQRKKKEVMIEHVMLEGINDGEEDVEALLRFVQGLDIKVNLIAYNKTGYEGYSPSSKKNVARFKARLERRHIEVAQRYKKGDDIQAACGQLAGEFVETK